MSDFYIFLEEDKHLNYEQIKNLSVDEMNKYLEEYIKSEKVNLLFSGLPIISLRWGWLEDIRLLLIVFNAFGNIYINLRIEVSNIDEVSNGELRLFKEMVKLRTQFHVFCLFYVKAIVPIRKNVHTNE